MMSVVYSVINIILRPDHISVNFNYWDKAISSLPPIPLKVGFISFSLRVP